MKKYETIKIYLKNGSVFKFKVVPDEYDYMYESWINKEPYVEFANGQFITSEIIGIEWRV